MAKDPTQQIVDWAVKTVFKKAFGPIGKVFTQYYGTHTKLLVAMLKLLQKQQAAYRDFDDLYKSGEDLISQLRELQEFLPQKPKSPKSAADKAKFKQGCGNVVDEALKPLGKEFAKLIKTSEKTCKTMDQMAGSSGNLMGTQKVLARCLDCVAQHKDLVYCSKQIDALLKEYSKHS